MAKKQAQSESNTPAIEVPNIDTNDVSMIIRINPDLRRRFKTLCAANSISMQDAIAKMMENELSLHAPIQP